MKEDSMEIKLDKMYEYVRRHSEGVPTEGYETEFLTSIKGEDLAGIPYLTSPASRHLFSLRPTTLEQYSRLLVLTEHPQLAIIFLEYFGAMHGKIPPWNLSSLLATPEDWQDKLSSFDAITEEDISIIIEGIFRTGADNNSFREIMDRYDEITVDYYILAKLIYRVGEYQRFKSRAEVLEKAEKTLFIAYIKKNEPKIFLQSFLKSVAGDRAKSVKTPQDYQIFWAEAMGGGGTLRDYQDLLVLEQMKPYIPYENDYSKNIVYEIEKEEKWETLRFE